MPFERELEVARDLALQAGRLAFQIQEEGITAEQKADESPVTAADRACEAMLVQGLSQAFPQDGFLGEEGANRPGHSGRRWIIDPIDGTRDFVRGIPLWAVLIGLEQDGVIVAGVAHSFRQNLLLWAGKGTGTWSSGVRVQVSDVSEPADAVICFNGLHKHGAKDFSPSELMNWLGRSWAVRGLGGAVDAMLVAAGHADIWIEPHASPWDFAALKILIEEAGGVFSSFNGTNSIYEGNAYACTPALQPFVQELLQTRNGERS